MGVECQQLIPTFEHRDPHRPITEVEAFPEWIKPQLAFYLLCARSLQPN